jgi:hypothetical protein
MSAKEQLNSLLTTRVSGEAGSVAAIQQASGFYAADSTLAPSSWGELSRKNKGVAVANYGGYINYKYGIDAKSIYALSDVIAAKHTALDGKWELDAKSFVSFLGDLKAEYDEDIRLATERASLLGKDGEQKARVLVKQTDALVSVAVVTPQTLMDAEDTYRRLGAFIARNKGNNSPIVAITEPELISA